MKIRETRRTVILSVTAAPSRGWTVIDKDGYSYRTFNQWMAALADEYKAKGCEVDVYFIHGWLHRDLTGIVAVKETGPVVLRAQCSWCKTVTREGAEPTTHTICPSCDAKVNADLDAKFCVDGYGFGV